MVEHHYILPAIITGFLIWAIVVAVSASMLGSREDYARCRGLDKVED